MIMKRALLILVVFLIGAVVFAKEEEVTLPNIFIYHIPDVQETVPEDDLVPDELKNSAPEKDEYELFEEDEIPLFDSVDDVNDKAYADFVEDSNAIVLQDEDGKYLLNIREPQSISSDSLVFDKKADTGRLLNLSKYSKEEYNISGHSMNNVYKTGGFSVGTTFDSSIDKISMLEKSAKLFTRYENSRFALSSAFEKTQNTTIGTLNDTFYLSPEFKLNNYFSIREVLSADITRNRKSSELIFSVSPYGHSGSDRFRLEVGAKQTIDQNNALYGTQLNFSTKFKL